MAAVLFGTSGTARELGPDSASSLSVGAARIAIGAVVLWAVVIGRRAAEPLPGTAQLRAVRSLLVVGGLGVATYTPLFFVAVDRSGVAVGTIVTIASGPFFAAGLDWRFRTVRPSRAWLVGTLITVVGSVVLVLVTDADKATIDPIGIAAALGAGLGYATYAVSTKATMDRGLGSTVALAIAFTMGVAIVLVLAAGESFAWIITGSGALMALYLGVVATGVAYVMFGLGLRRLASATAVTLVLAEPVTAAVLAVAVLDESIPVAGWLGIGLVCVGLWFVGRNAGPAVRSTD